MTIDSEPNRSSMLDGNISRRDFVRSTIVAASAPLLAGGLVPKTNGQEVGVSLARGTVFEDLNGSGRLVPGNPGIPDVLVSNGREIVRTDRHGRYQIELATNQTVYVIKPRDWMTPVSNLQLPQFYRHHFPEGSKKWRPDNEPIDSKWFYPGIAPTGPMPETIDFPLIRRPEKNKFRFLVFGDPQPGNDEQLDWMGRTVVQELVDVEDVAFGVTLGDIVNISRLEYFAPVNQMIAKIGVPWHNVVGNHDQDLIVPDDTTASATFEGVYGPSTYAFEYGPVSFVVLNNVIREPFAGFENANDSSGGYRPRGDQYHAGLRPDQFVFLENYLATVPKERPLVLLMHIPIGTLSTTGEHRYESKLFEMLSGRPHTLSVSGHTHVQSHYFIGRERGFRGPDKHHHFNSICVRGAGYRGPLDETLIPSCMAEDGCEQGYSYITFDGLSYDITYKSARNPAEHQMNVFMPSVVKVGDSANVVVNVFAGSSRSSVLLHIDGFQEFELELARAKDPAMLDMYELQDSDEPWRGPKYRGDSPKWSRHIWSGNLPSDLPPGAHMAEVKTTDMFGKIYTAKRPFRVVSTSN